ncbi:hypothetical protein ACTXT7_009719 [Hymenolepis weldensis]
MAAPNAESIGKQFRAQTFRCLYSCKYPGIKSSPDSSSAYFNPAFADLSYNCITTLPYLINISQLSKKVDGVMKSSEVDG